MYVNAAVTREYPRCGINKVIQTNKQNHSNMHNIILPEEEQYLGWLTAHEERSVPIPLRVCDTLN